MTEEWPEPEQPTEPAVPAETRRDRFHRILQLEGLAAAAKTQADDARNALDAEARAEYTATGAAPSWRMTDLGTAALHVSKQAVVVADIAELLAWCRTGAPEQIRTVEEVQPAFQAWLAEHCLVVDGKPVHPQTGEVIPGLAVRPGGLPRAFSFRPDAEVKSAFHAYGRQWLADILASQQ